MLTTFSTLGCGQLDLPEIVSLARRHRIGSLELRAVSGSLDMPAWLQSRFGSPDAWATWLRTQNIAVCSIDTSYRLLSGTDEERDVLLDHAKWAEAAGVPRLRVFDGGKRGDDAEIERAVRTLAWWREERVRRGWRVDLMMETHDALVSMARLQRFLEAAPDTAILWDCHHTWKKGGEDPLFTWRAIASRTVHIHVKDSVSTPGRPKPYTYVPLGEGEFPMMRLQSALRGSRYDGVVSLEWERWWYPELPDLDSALVAARKNGWL